MSGRWKVYRNHGGVLRLLWWVALPPEGQTFRRQQFPSWREAYTYADKQARQ